MIEREPSLRGARVVITGVAGTIGQALLERVLTMHPHSVHGIDINAAELALMAARHADSATVTFAVTDIRDADALGRDIAGADVVFHAAAMKDVTDCERDPEGAAETNVRGTRNVLAAVRTFGVPQLVFTSTDKAVNPVSVMGATKLLGERLITRAQQDALSGSKYCIARFVNVLGSSASVIPVFHQQIARGGPLTLTDPRMTRFVMSLRDAITLILKPLASGVGGDIFFPKMKAMRVAELADVMIDEAGASGMVEVRTIGARPAEKIDEEIITAEESQRVIEYGQHYVIPARGTPAQRYDGYLRVNAFADVHSGMVRPMTGEVLRSWLRRHQLLRPHAEIEPSAGAASLSLA